MLLLGNLLIGVYGCELGLVGWTRVFAKSVTANGCMSIKQLAQYKRRTSWTPSPVALTDS